jgi:thymidylate synthase ThyX
VHAQPYVKSQRNDRQTDYDRTKAPQDSPVDMIWDMNAEEFLTICNKRLCYKASRETRDVVYKMTQLVAETNPEFVPFMVPNCFHMNMSCPEFEPCGMYNVRILNWRVDEAEDIRK